MLAIDGIGRSASRTSHEQRGSDHDKNFGTSWEDSTVLYVSRHVDPRGFFFGKRSILLLLYAIPRASTIRDESTMRLAGMQFHTNAVSLTEIPWWGTPPGQLTPNFDLALRLASRMKTNRPF